MFSWWSDSNLHGFISWLLWGHFTWLSPLCHFLPGSEIPESSKLILMSTVFNFTVYLPAAALVFVFALTLVAKFQPYKYKRNNTSCYSQLLVDSCHHLCILLDSLCSQSFWVQLLLSYMFFCLLHVPGIPYPGFCFT